MKEYKLYWILVIFFCFFILFQITTGSVLFFKKIGYKPSLWYEYYYGSEETQKYFSESESYKEPLTISGRLKVLYSHLFAYALLIFSLTHLIRSINKNKFRRNQINIFCILYFIVGFLEIFLDFFLVIIQNFNFIYKLIALYLRFFAFITFVVFTFISLLIFIFLLHEEKRINF